MKFFLAIIASLALVMGVQSFVLPYGVPQVSSPYFPYAAHGLGVYGPSVAVHAPVVVPGVQGTYVAKTRGAVHTAPLEGHLNSVANVNVAPAPGTL
ncbi:adult cuticle protein 1-like isoform X2 [Musca domestica]|uniref:Adult cuticle protein 1-like isoform X2 n=1 Tax=Musca domestica TaxID=7370 RepID=A0ABM3VNI3_MUSDO|nr:adult cuticle protein 1-like isoform X2 [Musca domestica]